MATKKKNKKKLTKVKKAPRKKPARQKKTPAKKVSARKAAPKKKSAPKISTRGKSERVSSLACGDVFRAACGDADDQENLQFYLGFALGASELSCMDWTSGP